jgi:hypothetical protein
VAAADISGRSNVQMQATYDRAYFQCMYARGHRVPAGAFAYRGPRYGYEVPQGTAPAGGYPPANAPAPAGYVPPSTQPPPSGYPPANAPPPRG